MKQVAVVGATGDVGRGIVAELLDAGYSIIAVGRNRDKLNELAQRHAAQAFTTQVGSLADRESGKELADALKRAGRLDAIIVSVNGHQETAPTERVETASVERIFKENVSTHLVASQTLIPVLADGGTYLGIGGGMADNIFSGYAAISMAQSAQRTLFRYLAMEHEGGAISVKELMLYAMINGESKRDKAEPFWITDREVGRHVVAVLADPATFEGPILTLRSKKQIGLPERQPA